MLKELGITNFAIIDRIVLAFHDGLNVISGETGAGKSILIGAIGLLLGDRASTDLIRSEEDAAVVEAVFDIGAGKVLRERIRTVEARSPSSSPMAPMRIDLPAPVSPEMTFRPS